MLLICWRFAAGDQVFPHCGCALASGTISELHLHGSFLGCRFGFIDDVVDHPADYEFTNVSAPYLYVLAGNPDDFLF